MTWNTLNISEGTFTAALDSQILNFGAKYENALPDLSASKTLLIASDYSGEAHDSKFNVYSFLITSIESWADWETDRIQVRQNVLLDSRASSR